MKNQGYYKMQQSKSVSMLSKSQLGLICDQLEDNASKEQKGDLHSKGQ